MPLTQIGLGNYFIRINSKSLLIEYLTNGITQYISFNLNIVFQIKILKNQNCNKS